MNAHRQVKNEKGYVEVRDEALHVERFSNLYFRVYVVALAPGQTTLPHRHAVNTLYVTLEGGKLTTTPYPGANGGSIHFPRSASLCEKAHLALQKVSTGAVFLADGSFFYIPCLKRPSIHQASAAASNPRPLKLMGIELCPAASRPSPIRLPSAYRGEYNEDNFWLFSRIYAPLAEDNIPVSGTAFMLLCLGGRLEISADGEDGLRQLAYGNFACFSHKTSVRVHNSGRDPARMLLLILPA